MENSKDFALAVARLVETSGLEPPEMAFAFGVMVKAMTSSSSDRGMAFQELVGAFMDGLGAVVMDEHQAQEVLSQAIEDAENAPPRMLN